MSNYQICYHFRGVSAHAAMSPEQGRSALDALELMNIGVQFLREHVPTDTRIHYAITDTGGSAPGTVQPYAQAVYLLRAVHPQQLIDLYDRVNKIARGAAMMTDTTVEIEFIKACSNVVINTELNRLMQKNLEQVPPAGFDEADLEQARRYQQTFPKGKTYYDSLVDEVEDPQMREELQARADEPIHRVVMPLARERQGFVSSDVGDVSWNCPVAQINAATMPAGVPMHSWQMVAVGKTPHGEEGNALCGQGDGGVRHRRPGGPRNHPAGQGGTVAPYRRQDLPAPHPGRNPAQNSPGSVSDTLTALA